MPFREEEYFWPFDEALPVVPAAENLKKNDKNEKNEIGKISGIFLTL